MGLVPRVTLTFDNGPTAAATPAVLDQLGEHGVRATFFACGDQVRRPGATALLQRVVDEGHWVGNHTADQPHTFCFGDHPSDADLAVRQIGGTQALLEPFAHPDRLFRPPGGGGVIGPRLLGPAAVEYLRAGRYTMVLWTSVPHDWDDPDGWVSRCLDDVRWQEHCVVVLHDIAGAAVRRLGELLAGLRAMDAQLTQDFPEAVVPLRRGEVLGPIDHLMPAPL